MSQHSPMVWTGLHVPSGQKKSDASITPARVADPPCAECSAEQRRACGRGLTCTAFIRYTCVRTLTGQTAPRDPDAEPAIAELMPLLNATPSNNTAYQALMRRADRIVADWMGNGDAEPEAAIDPSADTSRGKITNTGSPKQRGESLQNIILDAVQKGDGTLISMHAISRRDKEVLREAARRMVAKGLLIKVPVRVIPPRRGPAVIMSYRVPK